MNRNKKIGEALSAGKSYVMFKENPLSVGTRLGYIFVLPASLYRSPVWQPRVWQTSFRPVRHTRSYLSNYISRLSLAFFFASRPRIRAPVSAVYVSFFLTARKIAASSKMLVVKSLLPAPSSLSRKENSNA